MSYTSQISPIISVVMAVFNGQQYVRYAIDSLLEQTINDVEFIFVDDGSTDSTRSILTEYAKTDNRILVLHQMNMGSTNSFIRAIQLSNGKYIARQDADDISNPYRFEAQLDWLQHSEKRVLCSTNEILLSEEKGHEYPNKFPISDRNIRKSLPWQNVFSHSSAMYRKDSYIVVGGYRSFFQYSQDYDLWCRLSRIGEVGNIDKKLIRVHIRKDGVTKSNSAQQIHFGAIAATLHYASVRYGYNLVADKRTNSLVFHKDDKKNRKLVKHYRAVYNVGALAHGIKIIGSRFVLISQAIYVENSRLRLNLIAYIIFGRYLYDLKKIVEFRKGR